MSGYQKCFFNLSYLLIAHVVSNITNGNQRVHQIILPLTMFSKNIKPLLTQCTIGTYILYRYVQFSL